MLEALFHVVGYGLCHQLPERSFIAGGYQLPVCARDTGIYLGFALSATIIVLVERGRRSTEVPRAPWLIAGVAFLAAMAFDGVTSYAGLRSTTNDLRLSTGLLAGYALPLLVVPMLNGQLWRAASRERLLEGGRGWIWLASVPVSYGVIKWVLPVTGAVYPLLVTIAILFTFAVVNLVIVTVVPVFERRARRLADAGPQIAVAVALTIAELAGAYALRVLLTRSL
ncbi:MAG: DUF2085 domain-containing protein [Coriobacteriales bacterium]|nr:DUF2085 domain-containing protein [Actinomycetes bacterium]